MFAMRQLKMIVKLAKSHTFVHESELTACCHENRIQVWDGTCRHDVSSDTLKSVEQLIHREFPWKSSILRETLSGFMTYRDVPDLLSCEPSQLLQNGKEDLCVFRWMFVHCLLQHRPHVTECAGCTKHNACGNQSQSRFVLGALLL